MAEFGIAVASKLIDVVGSDVIREVCSIWGYKSHLDDLKDTVTTIRHILLDAEAKNGQLDNKAQHYIRQLKDVVYDADDLFDKLLTLAELKQHNKSTKLSDKVHDFFSPKSNSLSVAYSMSRAVKKIRKKLDGIASNHNTFGLSIDSQPIRKRREETCSYVYKDEVIGRESDVDKVVNMLLDFSSPRGISFVSIVGVGGLGKTTLAQLVFNDDRVKSEFSLRLWTCVSNENTKDFNVKKILADILESASHEKHDGLSMDSIQSKFSALLGGKKFLIVLDDLWNEDRDKWLGLKKFLMVGGIESRVLVTTRSATTALVVGDNSNNNKYELKGLSAHDSWRLFEMTAFGNENYGMHDVYFYEQVKLGKQIVEKCVNVPLAIRVVGTLLYGQNINKWRSFQEYGLVKLHDRENEIMSILKLSYDNLESPLKACFTYCSLFPKDFRIKKEKLIRLWMAQGYIVPFDVGQSLEDAAEEYILVLLRRCFFQEVQMNEYGGVQSFKIHDLIHDVAQNLAGKDAVALDSITSDLSDDVHHIFHLGSRREGDFFPKCKIRSYIRDDHFDINFPVVKLLENWNSLRTLDLHDLCIPALPNAIGEVLHLRYLDLSGNSYFRQLPDSITNLYNLQILELCGCSNLEKLPMDLAKLVNLRHLGISWCRNLRHMPSGLDKLSCLCVLTDFVVGEGRLSGLESLQALTNLRGSLHLRTWGDLRIVMESDESEKRYLKRMKHLDTLKISISGTGNLEKLFERLEPPSSVKVLELEFYKDSRLPTNWYGVEDNLATLLPILVRVEISLCDNLVHLPSLSKLLHLKSLLLHNLKKLEYMEDTTHKTAAVTFFPSLESLTLIHMEKLKGWWKTKGVTCNVWQPSFIKLSKLVIDHCGKLTSFPNCPRLEKFTSFQVNKDLLKNLGKEKEFIKVKELTTDNLDNVKSFLTESLTSLCIGKDREVESFTELGTTFFTNCSSLRSLRIKSCPRLRSLNGGWWKHLTSLESLEIYDLPKLVCSGLGWDTDDDGILERSHKGSLTSLEFLRLKMKTLPKVLRYLTSLQDLRLYGCVNLECLPEWISCLSSLQFLRVWNCPLVTGNYQDKDGNDWLNIQHIPNVDIRT